MKCPECKILVSNIIDIPEILVGYSCAATCNMCGHIIEVAREMDGLKLYRMNREFILRLDDNSRKDIYEYQERVHHKLGQWG